MNAERQCHIFVETWSDSIHTALIQKHISPMRRGEKISGTAILNEPLMRCDVMRWMPDLKFLYTGL